MLLLMKEEAASWISEFQTPARPCCCCLCHAFALFICHSKDPFFCRGRHRSHPTPPSSPSLSYSLSFFLSGEMKGNLCSLMFWGFCLFCFFNRALALDLFFFFVFFHNVDPSSSFCSQLTHIQSCTRCLGNTIVSVKQTILSWASFPDDPSAAVS